MRTASSRSSARSAALALLVGAALAATSCFVPAAHAQEEAVEDATPAGPLPVVREIVFRGNKVTQPQTMLREMTIKVGDPADPRRIEESRQGVQDLGLFRSVTAHEEAMAGGVRLVLAVKEKFYILPLPRADANSDGGYGYGAQLRWDNVWGLNHSFTPYFERRQPSEGDDDPETRGVMTRSQLRYFAPFIFDTKYSAALAAGYFKTPYLTPDRYESLDTFLSATLLRKISDGKGSQGWTASAGMHWNEEVNSGVAPVPDRGHALSLSAGLAYRDLHFHVYSDEGVTYGVDVQSATKDIASDYDFTRYSVSAARYIPIGTTPHQSLNFLVEASARHDGTGEQFDDTYAIGGVETSRAFEPETVKGDAYYAASVEYLRPVFRKSIRALVVVDAANAFEEPRDANFDKAYVSAGFGLRIRFQAFVSFDLEFGIAWPVNGGGPRLFASKV
jgi:outer membrane protein assembly factor BamA